MTGSGGGLGHSGSGPSIAPDGSIFVLTGAAQEVHALPVPTNLRKISLLGHAKRLRMPIAAAHRLDTDHLSSGPDAADATTAHVIAT